MLPRSTSHKQVEQHAALEVLTFFPRVAFGFKMLHIPAIFLRKRNFTQGLQKGKKNWLFRNDCGLFELYFGE